MNRHGDIVIRVYKHDDGSLYDKDEYRYDDIVIL